MRVLVACEYSGVVREAFRARGHTAFSVDLLPAEDGSPWHYEDDAVKVANSKNILTGKSSWDLVIAHPPCTYLANSGWFRTKGNQERMDLAAGAMHFFLQLWDAPIPRICIENPVPGTLLKNTMGSPTQYIQPYMFGDDASKKTGLWLKNLPKLSIPPEEEWVQPRIVATEWHPDGSPKNGRKRWSNQTDSGQNKLPPSKTRAHERSRTYEGIAKAFADNWG